MSISVNPNIKIPNYLTLFNLTILVSIGVICYFGYHLTTKPTNLFYSRSATKPTNSFYSRLGSNYKFIIGLILILVLCSIVVNVGDKIAKARLAEEVRLAEVRLAEEVRLEEVRLAEFRGQIVVRLNMVEQVKAEVTQISENFRLLVSNIGTELNFIGAESARLIKEARLAEDAGCPKLNLTISIGIIFFLVIFAAILLLKIIEYF